MCCRSMTVSMTRRRSAISWSATSRPPPAWRPRTRSSAAAVCLVTAGPGATNLVTNVAEAFVGALPMVILAGRGATATTFRGASQEVDTELVFRPITKWAERIDRADLIPDALHEAFAVARNGKPGPVYLDLPRDILLEAIKFGR